MARDTRIVVGSEVAKVNVEAHRDALTSGNAAGAGEGRKAARGLGELPIRRLEVGLHDRIASSLARIRRRELDVGAGGVGPEVPEAERERRVAEALAEVELRGARRERFVVAVAHEHILDVVRDVRVAEVLRARGVLVAARDRGGEATTGLRDAGQDIRERVPRFHAARPRDHERRKRVALRPRKVHDVAGVDHRDRALKRGTDPRDQGFFLLSEEVRAGRELRIAVLPRRAADHHNGHIVTPRGGVDLLILELELGVMGGPLAPHRARVCRLLPTEAVVGRGELLIDRHSARFAKRIREVRDVRRVHITARAITDGEPILRRATKERNAALGRKRQHAVIAKKHRGLRREFTRLCRKPRIETAIRQTISGGRMLGHRFVTHGAPR